MEVDITDKGRKYNEKLKAMSMSERYDEKNNSKSHDFILLNSIVTGGEFTLEGSFYNNDMDPKSEFASDARASFRRLFEAGMIEVV